jgi:metal-dependent amidase/aminoacylase/carboxypeptidase family protein
LQASAAPWEGTNAFDAAMLAYSGVSVLRQQMKPDHRVHGVIKGPGNLAANGACRFFLPVGSPCN